MPTASAPGTHARRGATNHDSVPVLARPHPALCRYMGAVLWQAVDTSCSVLRIGQSADLEASEWDTSTNLLLHTLNNLGAVLEYGCTAPLLPLSGADAVVAGLALVSGARQAPVDWASSCYIDRASACWSHRRRWCAARTAQRLVRHFPTAEEEEGPLEFSDVAGLLAFLQVLLKSHSM